MTKHHHITDPRRFAAAVDRLDAVSPTDRQAAAKHVYDVCVYHVARVRAAYPTPPSLPPPVPHSVPLTHPHHPHYPHHPTLRHPSAPSYPNPGTSTVTATTTTSNTNTIPNPNRNANPALPQPAPPSVHFVFDLIHPHVYRIARRLDRAMRYADASPHAADAAALICAVDTQGALGALFAVAQNAGVAPAELDALALPLRKRSAPALLRTLFSPDMRVANAAKKALRQVITIAACQHSPWMSTIRSALSLRTAARVNRSVQLRNLLSRLAEILHLVIKQAAASKALQHQSHHSPYHLHPYPPQQQSFDHSQQQPQQQVYGAPGAVPAQLGSAGAVVAVPPTPAPAPSHAKRAAAAHRASLVQLVRSRPRHSLHSDRFGGVHSGAATVSGVTTASLVRRVGLLFRRRDPLRSSSRMTAEVESVWLGGRRALRRAKAHPQPQSYDPSLGPRPPPGSGDIPLGGDDDWYSVASAGVLSTGGASNPGSVFSSVAESGGGQHRRGGRALRYTHHHQAAHQSSATGSQQQNQQQQQLQHQPPGTIKRDAATAMYIFERLLAKRTNPDLDDRVQVLKVLADVAVSAFGGPYGGGARAGGVHADEYAAAMTAVFARHGRRIYSVVLDILFRPVRGEGDAHGIGIFSFADAGLGLGVVDATGTKPGTASVGTVPASASSIPLPHAGRRHSAADFPHAAVCLPNMECSADGAATSHGVVRLLLRHVPAVCGQRMALVTGCINTAFLYCSEALSLGGVGAPAAWDVGKLTRATDSLGVLTVAVPPSVDAALDCLVRDPVTLRLVIETCIRSVGATGRLLAHNAARPSAARAADRGTLDAARAWRRLVHVLPATAAWPGTPSYSSSVLFLAQATRRAALVAVARAHRRRRQHQQHNGIGGNGSKKRFASTPAPLQHQPQQQQPHHYPPHYHTHTPTSTHADKPPHQQQQPLHPRTPTTHTNTVAFKTDDPHPDVHDPNTPEQDEHHGADMEYHAGQAAADPSPPTKPTEAANPGPDEYDDDDEEDDVDADGDADSDQEHVLVTELHECVMAMINVPGTSSSDIFFELYRTVVYLYANDLKKQAKAASLGNPTGVAGKRAAAPTTPTTATSVSTATAPKGATTRTQSDEDAKGILVENIAVDGQLPSRALRRAVMASEIDLGEYFDMRHMAHASRRRDEDDGQGEREGQGGHGHDVHDGRGAATGDNEAVDDDAMSIGAYTFEEFAHALAIIMGMLCKQVLVEGPMDSGVGRAADGVEDEKQQRHEAEATVGMIGRDVYRSGSSYLRKVHRRAKAIMRKELAGREMDWRTQRYEARIRRLEEQVASLRSVLLDHGFGPGQGPFGHGHGAMSRRRSVPAAPSKLCGWCAGDDDDDDSVNGCLCLNF